MSKEILLVVDAVSNEKGVESEVIFQAIEAALEMATKKRAGQDIHVKVSINRKTGDYTTVRRWLVISNESEEGDAGFTTLTLTEARTKDHSVGIGFYVEEPMESVEF